MLMQTLRLQFNGVMHYIEFGEIEFQVSGVITGGHVNEIIVI